MDNEKCSHIWISNSGRGGEPKYTLNREMAVGAPTMHVMCDECGARTWLTEEQWNDLSEAPK